MCVCVRVDLRSNLRLIAHVGNQINHHDGYWRKINVKNSIIARHASNETR